jgi:hypothetical protein
MPVSLVQNSWRSRLTVCGINGCSTSYGLHRITLTNGRDGVSNPAWRGQVSRVEDATTAFSGTKDFLSRLVPMTFTVTWSGNGFPDSYNYLGYGFLDLGFSTPSAPLPESPRTDNLFLRRVREVNTKFEGSTFLGELKDTIRLFRRPLSAIRELLERQAIAKRQYRRLGGREYARAIAGTWLETSFGILPLISEMQNFRDALKGMSNRPAAIKVNARREWKEPVGVVSATTSFSTPYVFTFAGSTTARYIYEVRGAVKAAATPVEYWGFDPASMVVAAWEVIPFSFLIDYLLPVGNTLEAIGTRVSTLAWSNRTRVSQGIVNMNCVSYRNGQSPLPWSIRVSRLGGGRRNKKLCDRVKYIPSVSLPSIQIAPSLSHLVNSIALLVVQSNRRG